MYSHSHIFIPSTKKEVSFCKICSILSYKGKASQILPIKSYNRFNIDPLKMKFKPIITVSNYKLLNHLKYLKFKNKGYLKIQFLVNTFGLKSMIFYKSICYLNRIFLENDIPEESIDNISSLCVLLVAEYNECVIPSVLEENLTKNENDILYHFNKNYEEGKRHKSNLRGLFGYIKKHVNNYKYWEVLCLKYLNYDLERYTAYDYLILFFKLGIFFCGEKINIIDKLKYCINILDLIVYDKYFCDFSQYIVAMSIIKITLENDNLFDQKIFKYIYGVDLSKSKYMKCSNVIKNILNESINNYYAKSYFNILNSLLYLYQINNHKALINIINEKNENQYENNKNKKGKKEEEKNDKGDKGMNYKDNKYFDISQFKTQNINNLHFIVNKVNNFNFSNNNSCINNNFNYFGNNYFFININNDFTNNCNKNFQ